MAVREVVIFPDERLREPVTDVTVFDDSLKQLAADMLDTMYADDGIGLAGPQVGVSKRIVVIDIPDDEGNQHKNPYVLVAEGEVVDVEGCLSVPGCTAKILRYASCTVEYQDLEGKPQKFDNVGGLLGICLQHETDHLSGKLFIDYLSRLKREMLKKKYLKYKKNHQKED